MKRPLHANTRGRTARRHHPAAVRMALCGYEGLWRGATRLLGRHHRLKEGLDQRLGRGLPDGPFDIWVQAASAGEAYLARLLLDRLGVDSPYRLLITTNTRQGKDIIDAAIGTPAWQSARHRPVSSFFPFDRPALMERALDFLAPRLVVLLETEIWPGLMSALKSRGIPMLIVNGRMRARSLRHYRLWPRLWQVLAPDRILAVSVVDARRYARLYGSRRVSIMPNMKFDRIPIDSGADGPNPVRALVRPEDPLVVLGSVRREEEAAVAEIIDRLRGRRPEVVIGLFPRHMHRIGAWQKRLADAGIPFGLRSRTETAAAPGTVLLWDVFGELASAYAAADAAFVGGSLAPLGGQNFLEPLSCGVIPTIGPSWDTFSWVGSALFDQGLVRMADDARQAADSLLDTMAAAPARVSVRKALAAYLAARRGGTAVAVAAIDDMLGNRWEGSVTTPAAAAEEPTETPCAS